MAMAKPKLIWANEFLALIFSYDIIYSTEARSLMLNTADPNETHQIILSSKTKKPDDATPALPSKLGYTTVTVKEEDAFRPTRLGQSPGCGN
ncbi:unnamed protein product [Prunus armeniaca]|uniref:Uncharacterized protein n=1 Tax=Prunus armeniaca TaxID=36596 RepID=A0A6J5TVI4_PRUAR|nr:unnamed protein product [Prunus armeniaca]